MPPAVLLATIAFVAIAILLVATWLLPLHLLVRRLARNYPGYYKRVGRPYVSLRERALPDYAKRVKAWRRFAWRLQKGVPASFPKDPFTRNLARTYRGSLRFWAVYLILLLLLVLPFDVLAVTSNWQFSKPYKHSGNQGDDTTQPGPSNFKTTASSNPGVTNYPVPNTSDNQAGRTETTDSATPYNPPSKTPPHSKPANPELTRADLTEALGSIAPSGQEHAHKQQVCEQLITEQQPADDLGPSPNQICTDANLQTYSTY